MCIYTRVHNIFFYILLVKKNMRKSIIGESYFEGFLWNIKKINFYPTFQPKHNLHKTADFLFTCDSFFVVYFKKKKSFRDRDFSVYVNIIRPSNNSIELNCDNTQTPLPKLSIVNKLNNTFRGQQIK